MPTRGRAANLVFAGLFRSVDGVVAVSRALRDYLKEAEKLPDDKAWLIYNCAQPRFFEPVTRRRAVDGRFRFFTSGRLVWEKNLSRLLDAMRGVVDELPEVELHIAGDGVLRGALEAQTRALGLQDHVRWLGFRGDVPALLDDCDAYVFPSLGEGCSNALIEAMARAAPVIVSDGPGNPEVAGDLGPEWLVPCERADLWTEAMLRLVRLDPAARRAHGEHGRAIAERGFSPARYIRDVEAMYERTAG